MSLMIVKKEVFDLGFVMKVVEGSNDLQLLRLAGDSLLANQKYQEVLTLINKLLDKDDKYVHYLIVHLTNNTKSADSLKLREILNKLPKPDLITDSNILRQLEQDYQSMTKKLGENVQTTEISKKIKKKKKTKLPKNYDPNVIPDPERWLPKYERKGYKKMKKHKKNIRVTQGADANNQDTIGKMNAQSTVNQEVSTSTFVNKKKKFQKKKK